MVSERGFEPLPPIRGLAPQASASANSATRTRGPMIVVKNIWLIFNPLEGRSDDC
jgi:hypothetical protein